MGCTGQGGARGCLGSILRHLYLEVPVWAPAARRRLVQACPSGAIRESRAVPSGAPPDPTRLGQRARAGTGNSAFCRAPLAPRPGPAEQAPTPRPEHGSPLLPRLSSRGPDGGRGRPGEPPQPHLSLVGDLSCDRPGWCQSCGRYAPPLLLISRSWLGIPAQVPLS